MTRELDYIFLLLIALITLALSYEPSAADKVLQEAFSLLERGLEYAAAEISHN